MLRPVTLGVIVGNRGFFPSHLCDSGRKTVLKVLQAEGIEAVCLGEDESQFGAVFSLQDLHKCADLFRSRRDEIDGILVTLPNFGEETAIANAIRWADLGVPVLVHAFPDDPSKMTSADRRDSFCGKMSCCNNLAQYGIRYSLTRLHTVDPESDAFRADLQDFAAMCRMVTGLRSVRLGAIGARPAAFKTVRYQREAAGTDRHLGGDRRSVRDLRTGAEAGRGRRARPAEDGRDHSLRVDRACAAGGPDADGQAGRRHRRLDAGERSGGHGPAMLDGDGGVLRRRALHADEHDEQQPHAIRL